MPMTQLVCPTCHSRFDSEQGPRKLLPFCSDRCRLIDLGRWLSEEHALPYQGSADDGDMDPDDGNNSE